MKDRPLRIDLHLHTCYSPDASTTLEELVFHAEKKGLDGVAITDHSTVEGAFELAKRKQIIVIPGLEVEASGSHILGLNLKTTIPPKLSITETVQRIHDAGGVAVIAHPGAVLKSRLQEEEIKDSNLDAAETINAAAFPFSLSNYLSHRIAERMRLPQTGGSDAHHPSEIGTAYTLIDAEPKPDDIAEAIRKGAVTPHGKSITWAQRMRRVAFHLTKDRKRYSSKFSI